MPFHKKYIFFIFLFLVLALSGLSGFVIAGESTSFSKGLQLYKAQNYKGALTEFQRATRENPDDAKSNYYLGQTYGKLKQHKRAAKFLKKSISINPNYTPAYLSLGINQYKIKAYDDALSTFGQAIKANPKDGTAYFFRGLSYQGKKDYQRAITAFQKSKSLTKDFRQLSYFNIGLSYYKLESDKKAEKYFQKTISIDPAEDISETSRNFLKIIADRKQKNKPWYFEASAGFEYNDNVISPQEDLVTGDGDTALILEFEGGLKFLDFGNIEAEVTYDFFQRLYQEDLTAFDFQSHSPALSLSGTFGKVSPEISYRYTRTSLGEVDFMQLHTITPSVGIAWNPALYTYLSYMYMDKELLEAVNAGRNATNNSFGATQFIFFMKGKAFISGGYRWANNDAVSDAFDYDSHAFSLGAKFPGPFNTTLRLNYKYTVRDYSDPMSITFFAPIPAPPAGTLREDDKQSFRAEITKDFLKHLRFTARYQYSDNDSNLPNIVYTENIVYGGLSVFF
ncbi:MAG: tetratricopeptide repeat protein [Nitrospinales bacterium]